VELATLKAALAAGDSSGLLDAAATLSGEDREVLEAVLGRDALRRLRQRARRARSRPLGRVVVTHGILGAELASVAASGNADTVWVNVLRLVFGRIADLKMQADGASAHEVRVEGIRVEYVPLLVELATRWDVLPFAYDWRQSVDASAERLDAAIAGWANGEPAHIVAHSMGGLVARRFIQSFGARWRSLDDAPAHAAGGRLVMLGTPNRGSFAIAPMLTGGDRMVKILALLDASHKLRALLGIIDTFAGAYQMLPSPLLELGDDCAELANKRAWGSAPVTQALLDSGLSLQRELAGVVDPARMIYVAGYDQPTPYRIRIERPGRFLYRKTRDGDGRVPHELGLLEGVPTFWVDESHGNLIRNYRVLEGIHDLLQTGRTQALEARKPRSRRLSEAEAGWQPAEDSAVLSSSERALIEKVAAGSRGSRARSASRIAPADAAALEAALLADVLGGARRTPRETATDARKRRRARAKPASLAIEIHCADITAVEADVLAVGHYVGVEPQNAELALDYAVSGLERRKPDPRKPLVLTELTRRGVIKGDLGDVNLFPVAGSERLVAIAGMGLVGRFGRGQLERLAESLASAVGSLPNVRTVGTVLIGSGEGGLTIATAVEAMLDGLAAALDRWRFASSIATIKVIERHYGKALAIHKAVRAYQRTLQRSEHPPLHLEVAAAPAVGEGATVGADYALALAVSGLSFALNAPRNAAAHKAARTLLGKLEIPATLKAPLEAEIAGLAAGVEKGRAKKARAKSTRTLRLAGELGLRLRTEATSSTEIPTRFSVAWEEPNVVISALTDVAVIPARPLGVARSNLDELVERMTDPAAEEVAELGLMMNRLLVPRDFRAALSATGGPVIFELDRAMAKLNWEMIAQHGDDLGAAEPLALSVATARQLRTAYSGAPSADARPPGALRALVVGDPGDPEEGDDLPGARREALAVAEALRGYGVEVTLMIGAPGSRRAHFAGEPVPYASLLDVLWQLIRGEYDLLHYCGHGDFDAHDPAKSGWLFAGGLLAASDLDSVDLAPRLVVANACLSGRTSEKLRGRARGRLDADLLPGLTDEFFRRGVRNYVGTAWEVDDLGAIEFAASLYAALLGEKRTLGAALLAARRKLYEDRADYGALWAAYQHYGTPAFRLAPGAGDTGSI
jgi:CHAT domain